MKEELNAAKKKLSDEEYDCSMSLSSMRSNLDFKI